MFGGPAWVCVDFCDKLPPLARSDPTYVPCACREGWLGTVSMSAVCRPWLLEVNHSPSFTTDMAVDRRVKEALLQDTLRLVRSLVLADLCACAYWHHVDRSQLELGRRLCCDWLLRSFATCSRHCDWGGV